MFYLDLLVNNNSSIYTLGLIKVGGAKSILFTVDQLFGRVAYLKTFFIVSIH